MKKVLIATFLFGSTLMFSQNKVENKTLDSIKPGGAFKEVTDVKVTPKQRVIKLAEGELFAYPTDQGYKLINNESKSAFKVFKSDVKDLFILKDRKGIFYKNGDIWFAEYYLENKKVKEEYKLKF